MPATTIRFDTGPATLPDVGELSYNGCKFSPLFTTTLNGVAVEDNAYRTVKCIEYTLEVDGYVTAPDPPNIAAQQLQGAVIEDPIGIAPTMGNLVFLLTKQGGKLKYEGRGFNLTVNEGLANVFDNAQRDVAWGPVPKILDFQPLGGGRAAKIRWRVVVRVVEDKTPQQIRAIKALDREPPKIPLLQFNYETVVTYDERYCANLSIRGTMEIPMSRIRQGNRTLTQTVDDMRQVLDDRIFDGVDLEKFYVTRRNYSISRDKRTMEFDVQLSEKWYMDIPPDCTVAHGSFSFRPAKSGMGLCNWFCTLRCSYTVADHRPRRVAWEAFLALLRIRMNASELGNIPDMNANQNPGPGPLAVVGALIPAFGAGVTIGQLWRAIHGKEPKAKTPRALLLDLSGEEGVYLDSHTTTFSASWRLVTHFGAILLRSGLWRKVPEKDAQGNNLWAIRMRDVSGSQTWMPAKLDPEQDIIVDFGGG